MPLLVVGIDRQLYEYHETRYEIPECNQTPVTLKMKILRSIHVIATYLDSPALQRRGIWLPFDLLASCHIRHVRHGTSSSYRV